MARPIGPRKIYRYSEAFRATAGRLDQLGAATVRRRGAATRKA